MTLPISDMSTRVEPHRVARSLVEDASYLRPLLLSLQDGQVTGWEGEVKWRVLLCCVLE